jgi:hypothetical protein
MYADVLRITSQAHSYVRGCIEDGRHDAQGPGGVGPGVVEEDLDTVGKRWSPAASR